MRGRSLLVEWLAWRLLIIFRRQDENGHGRPADNRITDAARERRRPSVETPHKHNGIARMFVRGFHHCLDDVTL